MTATANFSPHLWNAIGLFSFTMIPAELNPSWSLKLSLLLISIMPSRTNTSAECQEPDNLVSHLSPLIQKLRRGLKGLNLYSFCPRSILPALDPAQCLQGTLQLYLAQIWINGRLINFTKRVSSIRWSMGPMPSSHPTTAPSWPVVIHISVVFFEHSITGMNSHITKVDPAEYDDSINTGAKADTPESNAADRGTAGRQRGALLGPRKPTKPLFVRTKLCYRVPNVLDRKNIEIGQDIPVAWYTFNSKSGEPIRIKLGWGRSEVTWRTSDCTWYGQGKFVGYPET
ncbi:hypothetical protein DFH09DRAFT_1088445 [Mycena vulgaris]|nr:hypothetical protein DFH09DRAFT_1088445 [Mycena vulgaris]